MTKKRTRLATVGIAALALSVTIGPGTAQAAKVTRSAGGGVVPAEIDQGPGLPNISVPLVQTFKLKGSKVQNKQVLDVDVTVNAFGSGAASNQDLSATLVAPKRDNADLPIPALGSAMSDLEFSDQSLFDPCNPFDQQSDECNYLQGGNPDGTIGTVSGSLHASLNPVFRGLNPKGTWRLIWRDDNADAVTTTLGETTLEVKTGRKFAKE